MSIPHAVAGQPMDVAPLGPRLVQERSAALFKSEQLEVIRLVLLAGKSMPAHRVAGEITLHCLEGQLAVEVAGERTVLQSGQLMFLLSDVPHSVTALEHASALLTLVLRK